MSEFTPGPWEYSGCGKTVYGYVPVEVVENIIAAHGGIKEGGST